MKIYIATHKEVTLPEKKLYIPIYVGCEGKSDIKTYQRDDTGDNISNKNNTFCELTAIYWIWKNSREDYVGLVHYRRFFVKNKNKLDSNFWSLVDEDFINNLFKDADIIVPRKRLYFIETLYSHYAHTHYKEHLDLTREIIKSSSPEYLASFDRTMKKRYGYMFNMFIMSNELLDQYCTWLFSILFELETKIDISNYDSFQSRLYGRVSEILFNVWLDQHNIKIKEINWKYIGKVDYKRKVLAFFKAKYIGKKFESSF